MSEVDMNLITIKEFAQKTSLGMTTARQVVNSKEFCDAGISVNIKPYGRRKSLRVIWSKYLDYISMAPIVNEYAKPKIKIVKGQTG